MKNKTEELIEKAFHHAMNFFKSNHRGLDNQSLCLKQLMELTGFDFETCLKIQNPVLSLYMAIETMNIGQSVIENNMRMVTQTIHNHLLSLQPSIISSYKPLEISPREKDLISKSPHNYSKASNDDVDKHFAGAYDNTNGRLDINGFCEKGNWAICRTVEHLEYQTKSKDKYVLAKKKHLNFSFNLMNDESAVYLTKFLHWQELNLTELNLGYNSISDKGIESLFYNLRNAPDVRIHKIQYINLSDNNIGDYGADYISESLISGRYPDLRCVDVSGNNLSYEVCGKIAKVVDQMKQDIKILVNRVLSINSITEGSKKQSDLFYGSKEEKQMVIKKYFKQAQSNGVDIQNVVVSKGIFEKIINGYNLGKDFLFGFTKCKIVPKDFTAFAEDKIITHVSPQISAVKTITDCIACYFETFDKSGSSQEGIQFMLDAGFVTTTELLGNVE